MISILQAAIGIALLVQTVRHGGGIVSIGVFAGIALLGIGVGRLYIQMRQSRGES